MKVILHLKKKNVREICNLNGIQSDVHTQNKIFKKILLFLLMVRKNIFQSKVLYRFQER